VTHVTRLRNAYRRIRRIVDGLRGKDLWQSAQRRCPKISLGNPGTCWCVCPEGLTETSVIYSIGVGQEISFDLEMMRRFRLEVHAFDPTPRSIQWVRSQVLPEKFVFHPYGVADHDGMGRFLPPKNPAHVSHTLLSRETPWPAIEVPVYRLATIMSMLGHPRIDVLKMDIEGAEYGVLADTLTCGIRPEQILVEFHHRWPEVGVEKTRRAIAGLNNAGYRLFDVSASGEEYSFKLS
jgi:FkbM family methyltransferase